MSVRVSFVVDSDGWGGAEIWLAHHLRRAKRHGVEASLVCSDQAVARLAPAMGDGAVAAVPLARHTAPDDAAGRATEAALRAQAPDLVVVNLVDPGSNLASLVAATAVAPTTGVLHLAGDVGNGAHHRALVDAYADLDLVIATATEAAEQVVARLARPRRGVAVVCNGVGIPPDPRGPVGASPPRIGSHGRLTAQKGYDVLLAATRLLVERGVELDVVIGGAGRDEMPLRTAAAGLPVSFPGWVEDHRSFLAGLDVFCLPSRHDALPLSLLEAMAEGLPCVATGVGDVALRVGDAVDVVPVEDPVALADALALLLADPGLREARGRAARARAVERLDVEDMVAATYGLLLGRA